MKLEAIKAQLNLLSADWFKAVCQHQILDSKLRNLDGTIICPSCARAHGRSIEFIYPLVREYSLTGDKEYLERAENLFQWGEQLSTPSGGWWNDLHILNWQGITVFNFIAIASAIYKYENFLPSSVSDKWRDRILNALSFIENFPYHERGTVNYLASLPLAYFLGYKVSGKSRYLSKAKKYAWDFIRQYEGEEGILIGEGRPRKSPKSGVSQPIDVIYNVEESLTNLFFYSLISRNSSLISKIDKLFQAHLVFLLDDGGWDNSFGSRVYKWTYWGGRTTSGSQAILLAMATLNPEYILLLKRHIQLLESCTDEGLLVGGPHLKVMGVPPCIHHTFCHSRSTAMAMDLVEGLDQHRDKIRLSKIFKAYKNKNTRLFRLKDSDTWIFQNSIWRATVCNAPSTYKGGTTCSGGTLALLFKNEFGPIIAAGCVSNNMPEPANMQANIKNDYFCNVPRIEISKDDDVFSNINSSASSVISKLDGEVNCLTITGFLTALECSPISEDEYNSRKYEIKYMFFPQRIRIEINVSPQKQPIFTKFILPIISTPECSIYQNEKVVEFNKAEKTVRVLILQGEPCAVEKNSLKFNFSPGFQFVNVEILCDDGSAIVELI